jgi:hypothetical protein
VKKPPLKNRKTYCRKAAIYAYDFETTNIAAGTPELKYITAFGFDKEGANKFELSCKVTSLEYLKILLIENFLIPERKGCRYIAWNGNKFDALFIGLALLDTDYIIRPYLTKSKSLRGMRITEKDNEKMYWEFLDGIAMTGIIKKLSEFIASFAPDFPKLELDFSKTEFDSNNPQHVEYAERDSEGLYYAMLNCNKIVEDLTGGLRLTPTIGNLGVKFLQKKMPKETLVWQPPPECLDSIHTSAMRGGFCFMAHKYKGKTWKYDINQAYAAAMRDAELPAGRCTSVYCFMDTMPGIYLINANTNVLSKVPFYYKDIESGKGLFSNSEITNAWITSTEYEQLIDEGWQIEILEGWAWSNTFNLGDMVNELEVLRHSDPEGPSGPLGLMCKMLGNNAYGKTAERLDGIELILAAECPEGFAPYDPENLPYVWFKFNENKIFRPYHQPQLAAFITAHVRMVVRQAALLAGMAWVYADTDCIACSAPARGLDIHPKRYGAWKQETDGELYQFIAKKVYNEPGQSCRHAKGLNVKRITDLEFSEWYKGKPPIQKQIQGQNFIKVMSGFDMYVERVKTGQKIKQG